MLVFLEALTSKNDIKGAIVQLRENGLIVDTGVQLNVAIADWDLGQDSTIAYQFGFRNYKIGINYSINVEKEGFTTISANQNIDSPDSIKTLVYIKDGKLDPDGSIRDEIILTINHPDPKKYYLIEGEYWIVNRFSDSIINPYRINGIYLESDDPLIQSINQGGLIVKGTDIVSQSKELKLSSYGSYSSSLSEGTLLKMRLHTISKDQYLFLLSYRQYENSIDNPFAEPTEVYSNVENGFGIFSIESITNKSILLK